MSTEGKEMKNVNGDGTITTAVPMVTGSGYLYRKSAGLTNRFHCQHEYPDNTWKCGKCGYQIPLELISGKIAETSSGRVMSTNV
jgi:hypothetical protein